jgi:hypothetical protein
VVISLPASLTSAAYAEQCIKLIAPGGETIGTVARPPAAGAGAAARRSRGYLLGQVTAVTLHTLALTAEGQFYG